MCAATVTFDVKQMNVIFSYKSTFLNNCLHLSLLILYTYIFLFYLFSQSHSSIQTKRKQK